MRFDICVFHTCIFSRPGFRNNTCINKCAAYSVNIQMLFRTSDTVVFPKYFFKYFIVTNLITPRVLFSPLFHGRTGSPYL